MPGGGSGGSAGAAGSPASGVGTLVPLYTYPTDSSWSVIVAAKQAHPSVPVVAVFNPDSGPGTSADTAFVTATTELQAAGIVVLGYVATGYTARDPDTEVKPEIDDYLAWYPATTGIFFDEQSNTAGDEGYYSALDVYAKQKGLTFTVGNPGTDTAESFVGALDTMLIYESDGLPSATSLGGWHANYPKKNFGIIPYAVPSLDPAFVAQAKANVGYIYLTDDDLPNPWDSLPPYFDALLAELEK
jgi:Spherulation-specific family 4